jgi:hypothetical protein
MQRRKPPPVAPVRVARWGARACRQAFSAAWEQHSFVVVESSFYDAEKDQLVWTAKTETMDDAEFKATTESIVNRVTKKLVALRAVGPPPSHDDRAAANR